MVKPALQPTPKHRQVRQLMLSLLEAIEREQVLERVHALDNTLAHEKLASDASRVVTTIEGQLRDYDREHAALATFVATSRRFYARTVIWSLLEGARALTPKLEQERIRTTADLIRVRDALVRSIAEDA